MKTHTVRWTETARDDLEAIITYIARDHVDRALKILDRFREEASELRTFPERGRIVPELQQHGIFIYHELVTPPWRIIYRIEKKHVYVMAVIDSRRKLEDILLERFMR